jgi:hypothetical protein
MPSLSAAKIGRMFHVRSTKPSTSAANVSRVMVRVENIIVMARHVLPPPVPHRD